MTLSSDYAERAAINDKSRDKADHFAEPWSACELEFLLEFWPADPEPEVAEALGRTVEACRQRFYEARRGRGHAVVHKTTTTTTTSTTRYIGAFDEPEDQFWSPDYYTGGGSHA